MNELTALLSALELSGGERILLRSDQHPQLLVGDSRHDLGTATVSTTAALENLAERILSPAGRQALADQRIAVEPLGDDVSGLPVRVTVRRIGPQMSVEFQRDGQNADAATVSLTVAPLATTSSPVAPQATPPGKRPATSSVSPGSPPVAKSFEPARMATLETSGRVAETPTRTPGIGGLDDLIRQAAQRRATAIYLRGGRAPLARIGDRMETLSADPMHASVVDAVIGMSAPRAGQRSESAVWIREHEGIRQRWHAFADNRGPGLVIELGWRSPEAALEKHLPRHVKRICEQDDGIVVVSGSSTGSVLDMISAVGNWTASQRAAYVVSIEPSSGLEHEISGTFVSTRRIGPGDSGGAAAIRRASHERPDVLVVSIASGAGAEEALRAARAGCLVILGVVAQTATRALESLLIPVSPQHETELRQALGAWFRCAFSYRALHAADGRRTVIHDLLVGTPDVCARLERGDIGTLEKFQRSGIDGMRSLDAALARAAARGEISFRQAASHAIDRREVVRMIRHSARERNVR